MIARPLLIQAASGPCEEQLALTRSRHLDYTLRHGFEYWCHIGERFVPERPPHWDKIRLILNAFYDGYSYVVWLDADCIIVDMNSDLRDALSLERGIGLTKHSIPYNGYPYNLNTGAIYIRNCLKSVSLMQRVLLEIREGPWWEQGVLQDILETDWRLRVDYLEIIDDRWNSTYCVNTPSPNPVVKAWHGTPDRIDFMRQELERING